MTYEALARGATGLFYFAFDAGWKMREHPETWAALSKVVQEVNERLPLFQAEHQWWAKEHQFGDPAHRFNAALQSSVTSCLLRVTGSNSVVTAGDYILAVNNTERSQQYSFALPRESEAIPSPESKVHRQAPAGDRRQPVRGREGVVEGEPPPVPALGEERHVQPEHGRIQDEFPPYGIHVYGPLPIAQNGRMP